MKWGIVILVLFVAGVAILGYAFFIDGSIASCDVTCQESIMPAVLSEYNSLNDLGLAVLLCCAGVLVWRMIARR